MNTEDLTPRTPALDQHGLLFSGPRPKDPVSARALLTLTGKARTFNFFFFKKSLSGTPMPHAPPVTYERNCTHINIILFINSPAHAHGY